MMKFSLVHSSRFYYEHFSILFLCGSFGFIILLILFLISLDYFKKSLSLSKVLTKIEQIESKLNLEKELTINKLKCAMLEQQSQHIKKEGAKDDVNILLSEILQNLLHENFELKSERNETQKINEKFQHKIITHITCIEYNIKNIYKHISDLEKQMNLKSEEENESKYDEIPKDISGSSYVECFGNKQLEVDREVLCKGFTMNIRDDTQREIVVFPDLNLNQSPARCSSASENFSEKPKFELTEDNQEKTPKALLQPTSPNKKRTKITVEEGEKKFSEASELCQQTMEIEDSTSLYAKYLTAKLNQFDQRTKSLLIQKINELIFQTEMNLYSESSHYPAISPFISIHSTSPPTDLRQF